MTGPPFAITFVCGASIGGAVDSTLGLASSAVAAGHAVRVIVAAEDLYKAHPRLDGAIVRIESASDSLGRMARRVFDQATGRPRPEPLGGVVVERSTNLPGTLRRTRRPGELVVVNSVRPLDLRRLVHDSAEFGSSTVWYLREESSLAAVAELGPKVDLLVANSRPLAAAAEALSGEPCGFVPSVIGRDGLVAPVERRSILLVNPIDSHGLEELLLLAAELPDEHFVLQESWPLREGEVAELQTRIRVLRNVEFRRRGPRSQVFRDARLLIAPHSGPEISLNRPRTALEAQLIGIPLLAHEIPGLASVAASPDLLVRPGSSPSVWSEVVERADRSYRRYSDAASAFADREMSDAAAIWDSFTAACDQIVGE